MDSRLPITGADAVVDVLVQRGVSTLFGLPGIQLDPLFNAFYDARSRLRVINARHEQGVAYMALGFAQATGRPGVYACVPGPGFLNTTAALSTAYACHAPVLALLGQVATEEIGAGRGVLQVGISVRPSRRTAREAGKSHYRPVTWGKCGRKVERQTRRTLATSDNLIGGC